MKTTISLDVSRKEWLERLSMRSNPIQDGTFEAFGVIGPCTVGAFLDLKHIISCNNGCGLISPPYRQCEEWLLGLDITHLQVQVVALRFP
jgi:hypothetical protein